MTTRTRMPIVTFSHLRWDFVYQRPQHIMTRLGKSREVLFVEEPVTDDGTPRLEILPGAPGVQVVRPHLVEPGPAFGIKQQLTLVRLLRAHLQSRGWPRIGAWLYTPMAVRVAQALAPGAIVYDCMDQLTNFWYAPPELAERERELLGCADVVFTGGPSLHRAKSMLHPSVHCFPSSVDIDHFATASTADCPSDQWNIPAPRLGFFGVLDERMDFELLGAVAARRPQWHFVMIGPVAKIDPTSLPRQRNIHYLGQRPYRDLPRYIAGWDLCLIPFVIGPATQFISPTKTLEYLAADRPVVSTPIADVADPYGEIVYLARDADGFVAACERALSAPPHLRLVRRARAARVLARTSWDRTVGRMDEILAGLETGVVPTSRSTRDSEWGEEIPA